MFINLTQSGKSADLQKLNQRDNNLIPQKRLSKISIKESSFNLTNLSFNKINSYKKNTVQYSADIRKNQEELVIQSDKQSEINDVVYAEGNVSVSYRGKILQADKLTYDKLNNKISAKGNISLILGDQIFKFSQLEYSFITEKGFLLDVEGSIKTNTLLDDLSSNFSLSDSNKIESLFEFKKRKF